MGHSHPRLPLSPVRKVLSCWGPGWGRLHLSGACGGAGSLLLSPFELVPEQMQLPGFCSEALALWLGCSGASCCTPGVGLAAAACCWGRRLPVGL